MNLQTPIPSSSYAIDPRRSQYTPADYRGMSDEADILAELTRNVASSGQEPLLFTTTALDNSAAWKRVLNELKEIRQNCSTDNWDNAGALKIESQTIENAEELIERIPNYLPLPEISPEPDGNINLEWYAGKDFVFEISVDRDKNIYYAGRLRGQKVSGRKETANAIPDMLEVYLRQFINR